MRNRTSIQRRDVAAHAPPYSRAGKVVVVCRPGLLQLPVCTENLVRFDLTKESLNVDHNGRADILPLEPGRLALQVQEPT